MLAPGQKYFLSKPKKHTLIVLPVKILDSISCGTHVSSPAFSQQQYAAERKCSSSPNERNNHFNKEIRARIRILSKENYRKC